FCFIAMEYIEGQTLDALLRSGPAREKLTHRVWAMVAHDALAGLHYAHELRDYDGSPIGVVHRDVSPHNIFVTYDGEVKIVDFGIAKALDSGETRAGVVKGKAAYMAPEQAQGHRVDRRADIYSAGVMLWEAVTGQRMWPGL